MNDAEFESGAFLVGQQVYLVSFDAALTLYTDRNTSIKIEGPLRLSAGPAELFEVESSAYSQAAGRLVSLFFTVITGSCITDDGVLTLSFDNGASIVVPPDPPYEAWSLTSPRGLLICQASGEVSYFPPPSAQP